MLLFGCFVIAAVISLLTLFWGNEFSVLCWMNCRQIAFAYVVFAGVCFLNVSWPMSILYQCKIILNQAMSDIFGASYLLICSIFFNIWNCRYNKMLLSYNIVIDIISKFRSEAIQLLLSLWYYLVQYSHRSLWYVSYGGKMSDIFFFDRVIVARSFVCRRKKVMSDIITVQSLLVGVAVHSSHELKKNTVWPS